ncbi:glycosyltransferase family 9 protein [Thiomonas sp.]|jgi:ADP-heptose:LPS heptosyltransferase|uniref:glycosyltransferase family 9 protein n=1 Tax=Thiomonas sp. TaxID=2047785 RepID=UPI002613826A|nr:glycosyltransferase family 9 protein [Thiomonas sp.]
MNWRQRWQRGRLRLAYSIGALLYLALNALALAGMRPKPQPGRVAVVFPDPLGDAVMWLPYGQALVKHLQRQGKQVIVIYDAANSELMQAALPGCEFVAERRSDWRFSRPESRFKGLRRLRALGVEETFYTSHPRGWIVWGESIVQALGARAIGFSACIRDRPRWEIRWTNRWYTQLIQSNGKIDVHVQRRFADYLRVLGVNAEVVPLDWPRSSNPLVSGKYWVLAPGASKRYRAWPPERFVAVARHLLTQRPDWYCVIVGTAGECALAERITTALGDGVVNLTGQTSVLELFEVIAGGQLFLGNDSGAGHIAAAVGIQTVIVNGGGHWDRCYPYPEDSTAIRRPPTVVGHPMPCFGCDWLCAYTSRQDAPFPCITAVTADAVMRAVDRVLAMPFTPASLPCEEPAAHEPDQRVETALPHRAQ